MIWLFSIAMAKKPVPVCDSAPIIEAVESPLPALAEIIGRRCEPLPPLLFEWMVAHADGRRQPGWMKACSKVKSKVKGDISPGFSELMDEVVKVCKLKVDRPAQSTGPSALLLGENIENMLIEGGVSADVAGRIGDRFAGRNERMPGLYGSLAFWADDLMLPTAVRAHTLAPVSRVLGLEGGERVSDGPLTIVAHHANSGVGLATMVALEAPASGAWIAVHPEPGGRREYDPVFAFLVEGARPSAVRIAVGVEELEIAYGTAGATIVIGPEDLMEQIARIRENLSRAMEYGREAPPDRIWVQPVGEVAVQRVVDVLDALNAEDGSPHFKAVSLAVEGSLVEWPEEVDAAGLR